MQIRLPTSLHYPITVIELLKQPNDSIERFTPLFLYSYTTVVEEDNKYGETRTVEKTFPTRFASTVEGTLKKWNIQKGMVIKQSGLVIAEVEEACAHGVQYGGMCVNCGKDMTVASYISNRSDVSRAPIQMIHDNVSLTVSEDEATKVEEEAKRRLIASKKLSLVVDLDQTIIHATVDPTVAEWQKDQSNPNYDAVKDVRAFQLVDDGPGARGCWYYIKLRPGLKEFLENIAKIYELHIYTMGTRAYARHIAEIVDPERKIFGDRILSRDESGSLVAKNLQRLFPVDTKMVVIIDDRGDVWKWNDNLIKVTPYDFFVGIGDINSSFLPKKEAIKSTPKADHVPTPVPNSDDTDWVVPTEAELKLNGDSLSLPSTASNGTLVSDDSAVSALEQLVSMGGGDDPTVLQAQSTEQDEAIAAQLQDRPLLQKQKKLDQEDEQASEAAKQNGEVDAASELEKPRHHLLQDHDNELYYLEQSLRQVHQEFFEAYAQKLAAAQGGRLAELRGTQSSNKQRAPSANLDLEMVPDVKTVMPAIKTRVLANVVIVFSGVVPLGIDIQSSDIAFWAKSFGAKVGDKVSRRTTHVIAARNRTAKVRQALRWGQGKIKIVGTQWLMDCVVQWKRLDETPYLLKTDDGEAGKPLPGEDEELLSDSESPASALDTDADTENESTETTALAPRLSIQTGSRFGNQTEDEDLEGVLPSDMEDEQSPVGGTNEDWLKMHDEMEEFLGSDADDSEDGDGDNDGDGDDDDEGGNSDASGESGKSRRIKTAKRSYEAMGGEDDAPGRKKQATGLSNLVLSQVSDNGLPTPDVTVEEDGGKNDDVDDEADDDSWGDFEGDLEKEMERAAAEEEERGEG